MNISILTSLICLMFVTPSFAQSEPKMLVKTFSVNSSFAPPPWSSNEDLIKTSEISREQGKSGSGHELFIWETIPKGESFEDWTKLYAITAEYPLTGDLEKYANGQVNRITGACEKSAVQFSRTTPETVKLFVVYCESYKERPGTGEIAFFNMQLRNKTLVKNYFHIRVPKFQIENFSEFPLSAEDIANSVSRVAALRLLSVTSE
jgi:hypothetical protein